MKTKGQRQREALSRREADIAFWEKAKTSLDHDTTFYEKVGHDLSEVTLKPNVDPDSSWVAICDAKLNAARRDVEALKRKLGD